MMKKRQRHTIIQIGLGILLSSLVALSGFARAQPVSQDESIPNADKKEAPFPAGVNRWLKIGTGSIGGNYYVLGELVGGVVSHPMPSLICGQGGTCGVDGLQALNMTSAGSMQNVANIANQQIDMGFVQSDIAYWAYTGTGLFKEQKKQSTLRAIASLYPESVHIIARKTDTIKRIADLKGKRVSLGAKKSGTLMQARLILNVHHLSEDDLQSRYLNNQQSIKAFKAGELDAMFFTVGVPAPALSELFDESDDYLLLSLDETAQKAIFKQGHYFLPQTIAKGIYRNSREVNTFSVFALLLCDQSLDEELVYKITKSLWNQSAKTLFDSSFVGKNISLDNALRGIGIPLHSGAKRYYNEIGKRF